MVNLVHLSDIVCWSYLKKVHQNVIEEFGSNLIYKKANVFFFLFQLKAEDCSIVQYIYFILTVTILNGVPRMCPYFIPMGTAQRTAGFVYINFPRDELRVDIVYHIHDIIYIYILNV